MRRMKSPERHTALSSHSHGKLLGVEGSLLHGGRQLAIDAEPVWAIEGLDGKNRCLFYSSSEVEARKARIMGSKVSHSFNTLRSICGEMLTTRHTTMRELGALPHPDPAKYGCAIESGQDCSPWERHTKRNRW